MKMHFQLVVCMRGTSIYILKFLGKKEIKEANSVTGFLLILINAFIMPCRHTCILLKDTRFLLKTKHKIFNLKI